MKILIIIPAYNEAENIKKVIENVRKQKPNVKILVIDDGSSDDTAKIVQRTQRTEIIMLPHNLGIGGAVQTGFRYAYRNKYDIVIRVDGDNQHRADQIEKILKPVLEQEAEIVVGSRFLNNRRKYPISIRRIGQKIISSLVSIIVSQRVTDATSGFRCYDKRTINLLSRYYPSDYPEPEEIIFCKRNHLKVKEVGILMKQREKGKSSLTPMKSIYYMIKVTLAVLISILRTPVITKE